VTIPVTPEIIILQEDAETNSSCQLIEIPLEAKILQLRKR
jgi:hypothetical protein